MTQYRATGSGDCFALDEDDGTVKSPDENGFVTLGVDTYLFPIDSPEAPLASVHIQTDATIAATFSIEVCNMPKYKGDMSGQTVDVSDWTTASGNPWIKLDPSTAYVATNGTGWTVTNMTLAKTAGLGNAYLDLGNTGAKRMRLKAVVTTGGTVRVNRHAKS